MQTRMVLTALSALLVSWVLSMVLGYLYIGRMKAHGVSQPINPDGPKSHFAKVGTPTAGGLFFLIGTTVSVWLFGTMSEPYTYIPLIAMWAFAIVGLMDDIAKLTKKESQGLRSSRKLGMQILTAALILWLLSKSSGLVSTVVAHPWNPAISWDIGVWYPIAFLFYMVMFVNAVNITDGLDGLATGVSFSPLILLAILAALFGTGMHGEFIQNPISAGGSDLFIVLSASFGGLLAFLWYNGPKAQVFMGDVGSHAIGALIAISALLMKIELTILVASGVFIIECVSSFMQIISIRMFNKKIFKMAPMHHHFEKKGVSESRIVTRFQIASAVLTAFAGILFMIKYR
ncbi:phospho-N-acetylmuramoyl-pentapeptide-transferase [Pleomorphochaeta sp. DL1XJH-081]|uniref:phospho-N-acetylmuramoyl-pentapeptide- transferase n=1 Tax=Pleomorphochaeta sp. DL1XJH-081 TaxID=3409690 RepID=UPI003BB68EBF